MSIQSVGSNLEMTASQDKGLILVPPIGPKFLKMKKVICLFLIILGIGLLANHLFAQCPESGTTVPIAKVMNPATSKDFQKCDIITEGEFIFPTVTNFRHPSDIGKMVVFQVAPIGEADSYADKRGQRGLMVAIAKEKSDAVFELKKGTKIELRGHTKVVIGSVVYFITDYIKKL